MKKLVIFDLDGTLLDTVADLAAATNHALRLCGFPEHRPAEYNYFIGNGINKLFERALPEGEKTAENIAKVRAEFLAYYDIHNSDLTVPYPGIPELLHTLQSEWVALAVASNKYHEATCKLAGYYFPGIRFVKVLGQREGVEIKPNPAIVEDILAAAGIGAHDTLYVGDSGVDMQTAANAGVTAAGVTWGFRPREELESFSPRYIVDSPAEILEIVRGHGSAFDVEQHR